MVFPKGCELPEAIREAVAGELNPCESCTFSDCPVRRAETPVVAIGDAHDIEHADTPEHVCEVCDVQYERDQIELNGKTVPFVRCMCGTTTFSDIIRIKESKTDD